MSDHHDKQASHQNNSFIDNLHKSDNGITTATPAFNESILTHSSPSILSRSRFTLFDNKLRDSREMLHHPRRNYGMPHLERV